MALSRALFSRNFCPRFHLVGLFGQIQCLMKQQIRGHSRAELLLRIGGMWGLCLWRNDFLKIWVTLDAQKIPLG
jgi:hypothetical protein